MDRSSPTLSILIHKSPDESNTAKEDEKLKDENAQTQMKSTLSKFTTRAKKMKTKKHKTRNARLVSFGVDKTQSGQIAEISPTTLPRSVEKIPPLQSS